MSDGEEVETVTLEEVLLDILARLERIERAVTGHPAESRGLSLEEQHHVFAAECRKRGGL